MEAVNRVIVSIGKVEQQIADRLSAGLVTQSKIDDLDKSLNMDVGEYVRFQELKTIASTTGKLTLEEAQTIYMYLGTSVETFNRQSVAVKSVLTKLFAELLSWSIRMKQTA